MRRFLTKILSNIDTSEAFCDKSKIINKKITFLKLFSLPYWKSTKQLQVGVREGMAGEILHIELIWTDKYDCSKGQLNEIFKFLIRQQISRYLEPKSRVISGLKFYMLKTWWILLYALELTSVVSTVPLNNYRRHQTFFINSIISWELNSGPRTICWRPGDSSRVEPSTSMVTHLSKKIRRQFI